MIFYESPYRVTKTLAQFIEFFGAERHCSACREISKVHEESVRGTLAEVLAHFEETEPRGEFVIVVEGCSETERRPSDGEERLSRREQRKKGKEGKPKTSSYKLKLQAAEEAADEPSVTDTAEEADI